MSSTITIQEATERFYAHLEDLGKKEGTVATARRILGRFTEFFGADKPVAKIRVMDTGRYFASDTVNKKPNGKPRAKLSINQHRRFARQFLIFCHEQGWAAEVPVPKDEAKYGGVKAAKDEGATTEDAAAQAEA